MTEYKRNRAMVDILCHYGMKNQIDKCLEELDELKAELVKDKVDRDALAGELADVQIMCRQMAILFRVTSHVEDAIDFKLERQLKRMEEE